MSEKLITNATTILRKSIAVRGEPNMLEPRTKGLNISRRDSTVTLVALIQVVPTFALQRFCHLLITK